MPYITRFPIPPFAVVGAMPAPPRAIQGKDPIPPTSIIHVDESEIPYVLETIMETVKRHHGDEGACGCGCHGGKPWKPGKPSEKNATMKCHEHFMEDHMEGDEESPEILKDPRSKDEIRTQRFPMAEFSPRIDFKESNKGYEIVLDAPGAKKSELEVDLEGEYLSISYHPAPPAPDTGEWKYVARERGRLMPFSRKLYLLDAAEEGAKATLVDGVLTVKIDKVEKPEPRKIAID